WTAAAGAAAPGRAALGAAPGRAALGATPGAPGTTGCPGGVTGAAAHPLSLVSFGLPGPASSPPAPRPWDPVWQFECTSPLASGSGDGVADATDTQPTGTANAAAATRLTIAFLTCFPYPRACLSRLSVVGSINLVHDRRNAQRTEHHLNRVIPGERASHAPLP